MAAERGTTPRVVAKVGVTRPSRYGMVRAMHRVLFVFASIVASFVACGDPSHVFSGRLYVSDRDCVATKSSIEVVEGDPAEENCAPTCLVQTSTPNGTRPVYVTTMCPPIPFGFVSDGSDPRCASALASFARNDTCFTDGGSSAPLPKDAGVD